MVPAFATVHVLLVPLIAHEIDRHTAGVVLATMTAPVLSMSRWDPQINRFDNPRFDSAHRRDDHRLRRVDHWRLGPVADIDTPVHPGLADLDRHPDLRRGRTSTQHRQATCRGKDQCTQGACRG
jgi:hypothetical protein